MRRINIFILLIGFCSILASCSTYSEKELQGFDQQIQDYIQKDTLSYEKSESGLYYHIFKAGEGTHNIRYSDKVTFTYEGELLNGEVFDKAGKSNPATFYVRQLIMGWKEAFAYLKNGGKAKIIVPPQLGYGDHELERIPKNSVLVFDMEILNVE